MGEQQLSGRLVEMVSRRMLLLADPLRVQMIFALREREMSVSEMVQRTGRERRTVSHHLNELYRDGVLDRHKDGTNMVYGLADFSACKVLLMVGEGVAARIEELGEMVEGHPTTEWFT